MALNIDPLYIVLEIALSIVDPLRLYLYLSRYLASYYRGHIALIPDILVAFSYLVISSNTSNNASIVSPYKGLKNISAIAIFFSLVI